MKFTDFPDYQHVENIKTRLWSNREYGQAAVMVGAGFSRNSKKKQSNAPTFPLWGEIASKMFDKLYPINNFASDEDYQWKRSTMLSSSLVLRLASEFESTYGRQELDNLLLNSIPDSLYQPGTLHQILLSLPWSDIFTTNYDTLLERTRPYIHERKYDVIRTVQEIPETVKPRIVKLNGSFPAHRPFIITEDDFRVYPEKFSPFVNMVQQSMMENAFCLVGFSGDDPNFLSWIGWVRDRLGNSISPIYLCGIFDHSPSLKKLLEERNIITIDLAPVLKNAGILDPQLRHSIALEWFLQSLAAGKSDDASEWLEPNTKKSWKSQYNLPDVQVEKPVPQEIFRFRITGNEPTKEDYQKIIKKWREDRENYPGWLVLPHDERESLWRDLEYAVEPILSGLNDLDSPNNIYLLYELNWRLERTLTPIAEDWLKNYLAVLEKYNPFPEALPELKTTIIPKIENYKNFDWVSISDIWVELVFSVIRNYRENFDTKNFNSWMSKIKLIAFRKNAWQEHWYYEQSLFHLYRLDEDNLSKTIKDWDFISTDNLYWKTKRAALLAELGDLETGIKLAEESLYELRSRYQPYQTDHYLLSQESWIMLLLHNLSISLSKLGDFPDVDHSRWKWLKNQGYDPWNFIKQFNLTIKLIDKDEPFSENITPNFDPGRYTVSSKVGSEPVFTKILPAFGVLRLFEECGLPVKYSKGFFNTKSPINVGEASQNISELFPMLALTYMLRANEDKIIKQWFTRTRVATLENTEINRLYDLLFNVFVKATQKLSSIAKIDFDNRSFYDYYIKPVGEMLSRLTFRLSKSQRDELLDLTIITYKQPFIRSYPAASDCIKNIFERCFYSMSDEALLSRMGELLSLPILNEVGFEVNYHDEMVDPFDYIKWKELEKIPQGFDNLTWQTSIIRLIQIVEVGSAESRKSAIKRLLTLHEINALPDTELESLYKALWSQLDECEIPSDTGLNLFGLLYLAPGSKLKEAKNKLKKLFLSDNFPKSKNYIYNCNTCTLWEAIPKDRTNRYIDWTQDEAKILLRQAVKEIRTLIPSMKNISDSFFRSKYDKPISDFLNFLSYAVLTRIKKDDHESLNLIDSVLSEIEELNFKILSVKPVFLRHFPERESEISQKIREFINSLDEDESNEAILAIYRWTLLNSKGKLPSMPSDIFSELIAKIRSRRQPGLAYSLYILTTVISEEIVELNDNQIKDICTGLEYLMEDTKLIEQPWRQSYSNTSIEYEQRPYFRGLSSKLSKVLYEFIKKNGGEVPETLNKWKEIRKLESLPEVKFADIM